MESTAQNQAPNLIDASLNYIAATSEKPVYYAYEPPQGVPRVSGRFVAQTMPIRNARTAGDEFSLDKQGFELSRHETSVVDFYNREEVKRVYYPEVERLLKAATSAAKVVVFDHQVRCLPMAQRGEHGAREYAKTVHNDYTANSGLRRVRDHLPPAEAEELLRHRFAEINVWRPIRGPVASSPLAVCDARSIERDDFVPSDLVYPDKNPGKPIASSTIPITDGSIFHIWSKKTYRSNIAQMLRLEGRRACAFHRPHCVRRSHQSAGRGDPRKHRGSRISILAGAGSNLDVIRSDQRPRAPAGARN